MQQAAGSGGVQQQAALDNFNPFADGGNQTRPVNQVLLLFCRLLLTATKCLLPQLQSIVKSFYDAKGPNIFILYIENPVAQNSAFFMYILTHLNCTLFRSIYIL